MPAGRPLAPLTLTDDERPKLAAWARRPKTAQRLALRARIVLAAADGRSNTAIAADLRVTLPTVGKWRQRFLAVADGSDDQQAARAAGRRSGDAVSHRVTRFNHEGLAALDPRHGGGTPRPTTRPPGIASCGRRPAPRPRTPTGPPPGR